MRPHFCSIPDCHGPLSPRLKQVEKTTPNDAASPSATCTPSARGSARFQFKPLFPAPPRRVPGRFTQSALTVGSHATLTSACAASVPGNRARFLWPPLASLPAATPTLAPCASLKDPSLNVPDSLMLMPQPRQHDSCLKKSLLTRVFPFPPRGTSQPPRVWKH